MPQIFILLAIIVFFSPSILNFFRDSTPELFSSSLLNPLVEKAVIPGGQKDIVAVHDMTAPAVSLGLASQNILDITYFVFDPQNNNSLFAGTRSGSVLYKYGEAAWFALEGSSFLRAHAYMARKIILDPLDPSILYILVSNHKEHGIVYSRNRGQSFEILYTLPKEEQVVDIVPVPDRGGMLFAGTEKGLLISSADYGASWAHVFSFSSAIASVEVPKMDISSIFVVSADGLLYISENGGNAFKQVILPEGGIVKKAVFGKGDRQFFVMTAKEVYETKDGGAHFKKVLIPVTVKDMILTDFKASEANENTLYMATGTLLLKSQDGGLSWAVKNIDAKSIEELQIDPHDENAAYLRVAY